MAKSKILEQLKKLYKLEIGKEVSFTDFQKMLKLLKAKREIELLAYANRKRERKPAGPAKVTYKPFYFQLSRGDQAPCGVAYSDKRYKNVFFDLTDKDTEKALYRGGRLHICPTIYDEKYCFSDLKEAEKYMKWLHSRNPDKYEIISRAIIVGRHKIKEVGNNLLKKYAGDVIKGFKAYVVNV